MPNCKNNVEGDIKICQHCNCFILVVLLGFKHKKMYNNRCTGYILGLSSFIIYAIVFIIIINMSIK